MGEGLIVNCRNCRYKKEFFLGVGEAYDRLEYVIDVLKGKNKREVLEILHHHEVNSKNFYHALYVCIGCGLLYDKLYVRIVYDGRNEYLTSYMCEKCEDELEMVDDKSDIRTFACPRCKKRSLRHEMNILWD